MLLLVAAHLALTLTAANADNGPATAPISARAVGFAESLAVRDLPAAEAIDRKGASIPKESKEVNERNRKVIRPIDPTVTPSADGALFSTRRAIAPNGGGPPNAPTVTFEGISIADTIAIGQGFLPPDTNGDVGPNHYVQSVNSAFRVWDKAGVPVTATATLSSLFAPLGPPCGTEDDGDPIVIYDQLADRWLISQFCTVANPNNHQVIAISKTGDPAGAYYLYDFMMPNNKFNDYPHFGMWPDAYYMTDNQFNQAGTAFLGGGRFAFDRAKMLVGDPTASFIYFDSCPTNTGCIIGGELPSDLDGLTLPPAGAPNTFAYFTAVEFGDPADALRLFDFHADFAVTTNSTFTERAESPLAVAAFDPVIVPDTRNVVPQPAPGVSLDAIADRLLFRLAYRNIGGVQSLIANHTVNAAVNPAYRAAVRFYQLSRTSPAAFAPIEQQTFDGADSQHRWMGSGAMNFQGDIAVGYSVSSSAVFPSIRYAARLGTDTPGTGLVQGEQTIVAGGGVQTHSSGRWGDYSDMTVDPTDDCSFWYTQEYYPAGGTGAAPWHTYIAKFAPGACATSPRGTISGTITHCTTLQPIANAIVQITGGYSRSTIANGTYGAVVPPGTYDATVTGTGYDSDAVTGLIVTDGGAVTFDGCLNGILKQPVADTAAVTADSCNSNSVLDPNEPVTVSFGIKNTGTLDTANLMATLQATGGVTNPGAAQTYGVVVAGGGTVNQPFTFTVANVACGSNVVATLALDDGGSLGTISYNLTTGVIATNNYSTGNIAVAILDNNPTGVTIPLAIADVMTLSDVNANFRLNHTFDGDLEIRLVHPDSTTLLLVDNRGGGGENFGTGANDCSGSGTGIDSQAATAIAAGSAPFAGTFLPESTLGIFNGKTANGTWNLKVVDNAAVDVGTVGCFKLELNRRSVCCAAPFAFHTLPPCRVLDTRNAAGPLGGPALAAGADRTFAIAGNCLVPPTAKAVSFNITVVGATVAGNLVLHTAGTTVPQASSLSYNANQTRANNGTLALNLLGEIAVACQQASGTVHFILDVNGYFE